MMKLAKYSFLIVVLLAVFTLSVYAESISGIVFHDKNKNQVLDKGEKGIKGVLVSNERDVVKTDRKGRYTLEVNDETIIFITKPAGYMTPLNDVNLPQFYYIHYPKGSPELRFGGIEPTGPFPDSVNFPLYKTKEPKELKFLALGDPQPRNRGEVDYFRDDVLPELIVTDAAFAIPMGDIVFDDLSIYDYHNATIAEIGIPLYNVPGNHDMNYDAEDDHYALETFKRIFGPPQYSFDYGKVHFVVLDDIVYLGKNEQGNPHYAERLGPAQLEWLKNDLALVPRNKLIVLCMHAPLASLRSGAAGKKTDTLYALLDEFDHVLVFAAHTHTTGHIFHGKEHGRNNPTPVHHYVCGAMCGSWWMGPKDERGIPIADQRDGVPNGWNMVVVDDVSYKICFKAARFDADYQLDISYPRGTVTTDDLKGKDVIVNVFAGSERSRVKCAIDRGEPVEMRRVQLKDPYTVALFERYKDEFKWANPVVTGHLWSVPLPADLAPGHHTIVATTTDEYGDTYSIARTFTIKAQ